MIVLFANAEAFELVPLSAAATFAFVPTALVRLAVPPVTVEKFCPALMPAGGVEKFPDKLEPRLTPD